MLEFLQDSESLRKWRLLGAAVYRSPLPWYHLNQPLTEEEWERTRRAAEVVERYADAPTLLAPWESDFEPDFHHYLDVSEALRGRTPAEHQIEAALIRDVFGNPFRPARVDAAWVNATVRALAQAAYEERSLPVGTLNSARLGVLADALEDAGCTNPDLLNHLRGPSPHVRGCWALDLILSKDR
jgi:hypothetical protein